MGLNVFVLTFLNTVQCTKSLCTVMAAKGNYHVDWDDFSTTSSERFRKLVAEKEFSDVTLVSDDGTRLPSHQVILATGCTFFKKILMEETSKNPLIFMRGVETSLLKPLLSFLYTGSAEVSEDLITQFVGLAEDLGVDGLAKTNPEQNGVPADKIIEEDSKDDKVEVAKVIARSSEEDPIKKEPIKLEPKVSNFPKVCEKCHDIFNEKDGWTRHLRLHANPRRLSTIATMIKLPDRDADGMLQCSDCSKKVRCNSNFRRHVQKHHLKIDFKCDQCDFQHRDAPVVSRHRKKHFKASLKNETI